MGDLLFYGRSTVYGIFMGYLMFYRCTILQEINCVTRDNLIIRNIYTFMENLVIGISTVLRKIYFLTEDLLFYGGLPFHRRFTVVQEVYRLLRKNLRKSLFFFLNLKILRLFLVWRRKKCCSHSFAN